MDFCLERVLRNCTFLGLRNACKDQQEAAVSKTVIYSWPSGAVAILLEELRAFLDNPMMDSEIPTFVNPAEVADYFKAKNKPGMQAFMTGGTPKPDRFAADLMRYRGVRVKITRENGVRLVTFLGLNDISVKTQKEYKRSKGDLTIGKRKHLLVEDGPPVYVEGNHTIVVRQLLKFGYVGRYIVNRAGDGFMVTVSKNPIKRGKQSGS